MDPCYKDTKLGSIALLPTGSLNTVKIKGVFLIYINVSVSECKLRVVERRP